MLTKIGVVTKFVSMFNNEITTMIYLGGIAIHVYVVEGLEAHTYFIDIGSSVV